MTGTIAGASGTLWADSATCLTLKAKVPGTFYPWLLLHLQAGVTTERCSAAGGADTHANPDAGEAKQI